MVSVSGRNLSTQTFLYLITKGFRGLLKCIFSHQTRKPHVQHQIEAIPAKRTLHLKVCTTRSARIAEDRAL